MKHIGANIDSLDFVGHQIMQEYFKRKKKKKKKKNCNATMATEVRCGC